ncbi:MAG: hypothetical protein ACI9R3_001199 [Verrucomicrobiales bacterium]|jgi:hypothetical protein
MKYLSFQLLIVLTFATRVWADVVLNEVVTHSGIDGLKAADGFAYDWIELRNAGAEDVDLGGHFLTDDPGILKKWIFPGGSIIPAGGYRIVFASDRNGVFDGEIHVNFKLNSTNGDYLALVATDGATLVDAFESRIPPLNQYVSYGRILDGLAIEALAEATPGAANSGIAPVAVIANFASSKSEIAGGDEVTLSWATQRAESIALWRSATSGGFFEQIVKVEENGTFNVSPAENTFYRLTVENTYGQREALVSVVVGPDIHAFSVRPSKIVPGGRTILRWDSTGTGHSVDLNDGFGTRSPQISYRRSTLTLTPEF